MIINPMRAKVAEYPRTGTCWSCGSTVMGNPAHPHRICDACDVTWMVPLVGEAQRRPVDRSGEYRQLQEKYPLEPGHARADDFDRLLDHAAVNYPSPA